MKNDFVPIEKDLFIEKYLASNPGESAESLSKGIDGALSHYHKNERCQCGNKIWVVGSAVSEYACFTCITGEPYPDDDYEITEACEK